MASAGGGVWATDEIPEVEMEVVERPPGEGRVGSKRVRDPRSALGSYGFYGLTTAEKKPMLQPHDVHALRLSRSSPGENLENITKRATKICTCYGQVWCPNGKNCTFVHKREALDSAKAGLLAPPGSGNLRGSEEGFQVQHQSSLKVPQYKDAEGSLKHELYRSLIHVYGEDNERSTHLANKQNSTAPEVSQGLPGCIDDSLTKKPITSNELVQSLVVNENHNPSMGHHIGLAAETYLDGRGTLPRFLGGRNFQFGVDRRNSLSDSHVSRTYLDVNTLSSGHQFRSFDLSISSDPLQLIENLSAYGRTKENLPNTNPDIVHKSSEHGASHASYSSHSLTGLRNPGYATSEISLGSPNFQATSQLGIQSHHLHATGMEKVNHHRYIDADKGCGTSRPGLLSRSPPEPPVMSAGPLSPIKDEVWETSVPFVPSFNFPDSSTPQRSQYDPFIDCIEPPKVGNMNNLKSSNESFSISSQHTDQYVTTDKSLNHDDMPTRNMSAKGANGPACLIASDRERSSTLDDNNRVKARDFRFHLAEHIKELIKPIWKEGNLSKDAHKQVVKKCVEKVVDSIEPNQVPTTKDRIAKYITTFGSKIEKLVKAYVDKHRTT